MVSADDTVLGSVFAGNESPLEASGSYSKNVTFSLPNTALGNRYLLVRTDGIGVQAETNETNNVFATPITIVAPDLVVTSGTAPAAASLGDTIAVSFRVENQGSVTAPADWYDSVYVSNDDVLSAGDQVITFFFAGSHSPLAPGEFYDQNQLITIPNTGTGNRYLLFKTDHLSNQGETNEANNVFAVPITLFSIDLALDDATTPGSADFGETINVSWTVRNGGTEALNQSWSDQVYLSTDNVLGAGDTLLTTVSGSDVIPLAAGGDYNRSIPVTIPLNASSSDGTYYLFVVTDAFGQLPELNENNNRLSRAIDLTLPPLPDLVVEDLVVPVTGLTGADVTISWTDRNQGTATATGSWVDRVFLSTDSVLQVGVDPVLGSFPIDGPLSAGASVNRSQLIHLPDDVGQYHIFVVTDFFGSVPEGPGDANNVTISAAPINVQQAPLPDLVVTSITPPTDGVFSGQTVDITFVVTNQGTAATQAPTWSDFVLISQSPDLTFGGYQGSGLDDQLIANEPFQAIGFVNPSYLEAGQSYTQTVQLTLPVGASGPWHVYVAADALGVHSVRFQPCKSWTTATISAVAPRLTSRSLRLQIYKSPPSRRQAQAFSGQATTLSWTVANAGTGSTPGDKWSDHVFISTDAVLDAGDVFLGAFRIKARWRRAKAMPRQSPSRCQPELAATIS